MRMITTVPLIAVLLVVTISLMTPADAETTYTVKPGDTLAIIAKQLAISLDALAAANGIDDVNCITVGQVLTVPGETKTTVTEKTYTVKPGDSLSRIAQRLSISLEALSARNNIRNVNAIFVGQVLTLPTSVDTPGQRLTGRALLDERARILAARQQRTGQQIVMNARKFTGTPYRWGGLSSRGMDCSGLVVRAMLTEGLRVPHHAADLYARGKKVTYRELQAGDLVFFNTSGKGVSHVGIWVGDNKFIHASYSRGVVVDEMKGYFSRRLVGARRLQ